MQTRKLIVISLIAAVSIAAIGGGTYAYQDAQRKIDTIAELDHACRQTKDSDGFGDVSLAGGNFHNQKGRLTVPCKIRLKPGSTLQMSYVQLDSSNLLIHDLPVGENIGDKETKQRDPTHVILSHVSFSGKKGGFQINLGNGGSSVVVQDSTIDYPASVGAGVGADGSDSKASLSVTRNVMRSTAEDSEGVILVSTGHASFIDNRFVVNTATETALLLGETCEFKNNINANDRCHGDEEVL